MGKDRDAIPDFDANGNLPPGEYAVSLSDVGERFAWNARRRRLFKGLCSALESLAAAGVKRIWIDGSFVSAREEPNDIDGCWEWDPTVRMGRLNPVFLETWPPREAMKRKFGVDFLLSATIVDAQGRAIRDFFQEDRDGNRKGILLVQLEGKR